MAADKCLTDPGEYIEVHHPKSVFDSLVNPITDKGEFETTAEFELRVGNQLDQQSNPIWVEATFDPKYASFDADASSFVVKTYAWDNPSLWFEDVFKTGILNGIDAGFYSRKVGLSKQTKPTGNTYTAKNAMGSEVTVIEVVKNDFGVLERAENFSYDGSKKWITNRTAKSEYDYDSPAISIRMDRDKAKVFRDTTNAAILIRPKQPFKAHGSRIMTPTFTNPIEGEWHTYIIVADILCAALTNQDHQVIALVEAKK